MAATERFERLLGWSRGALIVAALALAASVASIGNGFALDDVPIIAKNEAVHSVHNLWALLTQPYWPPDYGQSLYRPFTTIAFTLQWAIGGGSPLPFHVTSIALYVAVSVAVLRLGRQFLDARTALVGAAIFAVHPLHVEAVANVVGQAELWAGLLVLSALSVYLERRRAGTLGIKTGFLIVVLYFAALMFKEHAIVLPGMIAISELILPSDESEMSRLRRNSPLLLALASVAVVFVLIRTSVIGSFAGGSTATVFMDQGYTTRVLTMLTVVPEWVRLFTWPASLSADYSPPRIATVTSFETSMIPGLLVLGGVAAIAVRVRRQAPGLTLALVLAGLALMIPSNLVVVTGIALAERALFLPSVGVSLALGYGLVRLIDAVSSTSIRKAVMTVAALLMAFGIAKSGTRSVVWKNNESLFRQTVEDVPRSYRAHLMLGELLTDEGETAEGLEELALAVRLSGKRDYFVRWFAADRFHAAGELGIASRFYKEALALKPSDGRTRYGAAMALIALGQSAEAREIAAEGVVRDPADRRFSQIVHAIDSAAGQRPGV